jgi:hypothetical protein
MSPLAPFPLGSGVTQPAANVGFQQNKGLQCQSSPFGRFEIITVSVGVSNGAGSPSGARPFV